MILLAFFLIINCFYLTDAINPDVLLSTGELIRKHGYPVELHEVTTDDGYILNLYRISHGIEKDDGKNKTPVLLVHGQGGSPQNFVTLGPKHAPAYYFADRGFDVWLFCARGVECQNPKKHERLDWNKDQLYWKYSIHHIGLYDLSASIDVILNKTQQQKIIYLGHSVGVLPLYVLLSEQPSYNDKIKLNINYAPLIALKGVDFPFGNILFFFSNILKNVYSYLGMYETTSPSVNGMLTDTWRSMCAHPKWSKTCKAILWCFGSYISYLIEDDVVELAWHVIPRISVRQLTHFMDNYNEGDFRKYDYGRKKNIKKYGSRKPPLYNITACKVPTAIFYGQTDTLTMPDDIEETKRLIPNLIVDYKVGPKFVHLDFIFAKNATHMLYQPTYKLMKNFIDGNIPT